MNQKKCYCSFCEQSFECNKKNSEAIRAPWHKIRIMNDDDRETEMDCPGINKVMKSNIKY